MALIKLGPLVADIRGSIGGTVFARNRGGAYARNRTTPLNPQSAAQVAVRAAFGVLSNNWTTVLTQDERDAWDAWAGQVPVPNAFGEDRFLSGINAYVAGNSLLSQAGAPLVTNAPTVFAKGPTVVGEYLIASGTDTGILTSIGGFVPAAGGVYINTYVSAPQNQGIGFFKGPFRFANSALVTDPGVDIPEGPFPLPSPVAAGQPVFIRTRIVTPDGRVGGSTVGRFLAA